ncbi:MAG: methyl-accepting chemotaxis protein, partial [Nitrospirota bacterium]|nr:methyl-accepting chemotaxis protein [Nitrospirota bacterium]
QMIFRKSITAKFIATVFVVLLVAQSLGTIAFMLYIRSSFFDEVELRMKRIAAIVAGVSSYPLLSYDYSLIDTYLQEVAKDEEITSIHIFDNQGKVAREKINADSADISTLNPFYFKKTMLVTVPVNSGNSKIGDVVIHFSGKSINDKIQKSMIIIMFYQGIALVMLGFVMAYFFNKNIKRPVQEINSIIEKITNGDLTATIPDLGDNEIGGISKGVGVLVQRLAQMIARINETALNVGMAIKQVDHTYRIASEGISSQAAAVKNGIRSIHLANKSQREVSDSIEKLLNFSTENVTSLLEMKATAEEMSSQTQRLFRSTEDSYSVVLEMSQTSKSISANSGMALSAVEDTYASVDVIGVSVREVEEHAIDSSTIANKVKEITSGEGMMSVVNAIEGMENISDQVQKSSEIIQRLGARSVDIEKVLSVIRDVTEQTNLLSLNAAILAAQAGEYGKSFSVVADEIRALSERTASSTREIGGIVKTIQKDIKDAVYSVDNAKLKVDDGNTLVVKVGEALREILNASIQSSDMTKAIERATGEQSLGLRQITNAVEDIKKVIVSVTKSTKEQENALSYLLEGVGDVKEVAELSKRSASEQAEGTRIISRNIELANERINQINKNELNQKKVNIEIIAAMENINGIGAVTMQNMEDVSASLKTLFKEIEALKQEMEAFRIC